MKRIIKSIFSLTLSLGVIMSLFVMKVSAASATTRGGNYEIGQSVQIPVNYTADKGLFAVEVNVDYNSSVLRLDSVSGVSASDVQNGNGNIKFIDDNFSNGSKKGSYTLNFTAVAAGNSNVSISVNGSDGEKEFPASTSAAVKVTKPKPSSNANLASIKLSDGSLSPAFNANTTSYNVTVKYDVTKITITGSVADGGATYIGGGTLNLNVGENSRTLTVTAADGSKKSYTVNVKRMTEQETKDAEEAARNANPLLVTIDGKDYTIVNDEDEITVPKGFELGKAERREKEIVVLNDQNGKYQLFWLVDESGENGAFYTREGEDKFTRVNCINAGGKMYIIEPFDIQSGLPEGYVESDRLIDGIELDTYGFINEELKDFYIVKCYVDGKSAYYCFDSVEATMQRAFMFDQAIKEINSLPVDSQGDGTTSSSWLGLNGKPEATTIIFILLAAVLIIIAIVVIIVIVASNKKRYYDDEFLSIADSDNLFDEASEDDDTDQE